jgi:hypothetical protein
MLERASFSKDNFKGDDLVPSQLFISAYLDVKPGSQLQKAQAEKPEDQIQAGELCANDPADLIKSARQPNPRIHEDVAKLASELLQSGVELATSVGPSVAKANEAVKIFNKPASADLISVVGYATDQLPIIIDIAKNYANDPVTGAQVIASHQKAEAVKLIDAAIDDPLGSAASFSTRGLIGVAGNAIRKSHTFSPAAKENMVTTGKVLDLVVPAHRYARPLPLVEPVKDVIVTGKKLVDGGLASEIEKGTDSIRKSADYLQKQAEERLPVAQARAVESGGRAAITAVKTQALNQVNETIGRYWK